MEILHDVGNEMHNAEKLILQSKMMADGMAGLIQTLPDASRMPV